MGEVVQPHVVYRHLNRAGLRISTQGDPRRIDLLRYAAWLFHLRGAGDGSSPGEGRGDYESIKEAANQRSRSISESARDIAAEGWVHEAVNADRKAIAQTSFRAFCESYFLATFHLPWSDDHLKVITKIEQAVLHGGLFAMAMPRGSGKTTLCETACLWAILIGAREFVCLIGSDEEHAADMLDSIKSELENNDLLEEDFSEVCGPIRALEGIHQRAAGQLYKGARTHIGWTAKEIILPVVPGSAGSGGIIKVAGITGRIRGMKHKRSDGKAVRPSLVLLDDPQTDESARSPSQCATREQILAGAILGLAGPGRKIAGLMTLTVVRPDDMADRILNRDKHPQWQGERTKMLYSFPASGSQAEKLWQQYAQIRADGLRADRGIVDATEFYRERMVEMNEGVLVAWPARHNPDELSASRLVRGLRASERRIKAFGTSIRRMGMKLAAISAAAMAPLAVSARTFAGFEQQMARVRALTGANAKDFKRLSDAAKRLGETTVFSASQAAEAMSFFALAGFDVEQILGAIGPALNLAAAGQIEIAQAADISAKIMAGMGLTADELANSVDVLTKAMTTANTDLGQLGDAMKFVGPVAKSAGRGLEEIVAAIQLLSNAGIQGEMAGTTLRGVLLALTSPSKEAAEQLKAMGVRVLDAQGNVRALADIIDDMNKAMQGLGGGQKLEIIGRIFDARQAAGFAELLAQGGDRLRAFTNALGESQGVAEKIADIQLDTLTGDVTILTSALEGLRIAIGEAYLQRAGWWCREDQSPAVGFDSHLVQPAGTAPRLRHSVPHGNSDGLALAGSGCAEEVCFAYSARGGA